MPYIDLVTNVKIENKDVLKSKLGELIGVIPGKTEAVTMISLDDEKALYYMGSDEPCVMVKTLVNNSSDRSMDKEYCSAVIDCLEEELKVPHQRIYAIVDAVDFWYAKRQ